MIKLCAAGCAHKYQDQKHGRGRRVMNLMKTSGTPKYRCTVCKRENDS